MRQGTWLVSILSIVLLGTSGGSAPAGEEGAVPSTVPQSGTVLPRSTGLGQEGHTAPMPSPEVTTSASAAGETAAPEQQPQPAPAAVTALPLAPPPSLQTLVDERRDVLRKRRSAVFDAYSGRPAYMPPWLAGYDNAVEQYRDAMRRLYRERRDYNRMRHNSWMDAMCPWSKPQRDWSERLGYLTQMEQLDRQEYWDNSLYRPYALPFAAAAPIPW